MATIYALQCVSEAARYLPDEIKTRAPQLPWRPMEDSSNVFRHGYHAVEAERVRATVLQSLPPVVDFARAELRALGVEPDA